jgi:hypothetical protein
VKTDMSDSEHLYKVEEERVGVPVKGGLYEVCICSITTHMLPGFLICVRKTSYGSIYPYLHSTHNY